MKNILSKYLFPLIVLLFSCNASSDVEERVSGSVNLFGNIKNANGNFYIPDAVVTIETENQKHSVSTINGSYMIYFEHTGIYTIAVTVPGFPGYEDYVETVKPTKSQEDIDKDIYLNSSIYKNEFTVSHNFKDAFNTGINVDAEITSNSPISWSSDTSSTFVTGDIFSFSVKAPGYLDRNITIDSSKCIPSRDGTKEFSLQSNIKLYKSISQLTIVTGIVTFGNSTTPVEGVNVYDYNDSYTDTYTDSNGFYSLSIRHNGTYKLGFSKKEMDAYISNNLNSTTFNYALEPDSANWSRITGTVYGGTPSEVVENATIKLGNFSTTTNVNGAYNNLYLYKGQNGILEASASGFTSFAKEIVTYDNVYREDINLNANNSGSGPSIVNNVTLTGNFIDASTGFAISASGQSITANTTTALITNGNYSLNVDTIEGLVTLQASALGYNLYSHSLVATSNNMNFNIELVPSDTATQTVLTGKIIDSKTNLVPNDLANFTLTAIGSVNPAVINQVTGEYSITVENNTGAIILQGSGGVNYHLLRRTVNTSQSSFTYDVMFDPK